MNHEPRRLFHYTRASNLAKILRDGFIKPATKGVSFGEKPVVWLSIYQRWEPTASPMRRDERGRLKTVGFDELQALDSPARIEVAPEEFPLGWDDFRNLSGCDSKTCRGLAATARGEGSNPKSWRVSFKPIARPQWLGIELFINGSWQPTSDDQLAALLQRSAAMDKGLDMTMPRSEQQAASVTISAQTVAMLRDAEIIVAIERVSGRPSVLHGKELLEKSVQANAALGAKVIQIPYGNGRELEELKAAVAKAKS